MMESIKQSCVTELKKNKNQLLVGSFVLYNFATVYVDSVKLLRCNQELIKF